jgi:hypothetical protein
MVDAIIMSADGYTATRLLADDRTERLVEGGVIRPAVEADRKRLASRTRVSYPRSGACWGDGNYVLAEADKLYVTDNGFNLGHVELARKRMYEQEVVAAKRSDLFARIDGARCPTCGR